MKGIVFYAAFCFGQTRDRLSSLISMQEMTEIDPTVVYGGHPLGPPNLLNERIDKPQKRNDAFGSEVIFGVERISDTPHMFILRNFVSIAERYTLQYSPRNDPKDAYSYTGDHASNRKNSYVSWLSPNTANGISKSLVQSASSILFSQEMSQGVDGAGLYEKLQLVRYDANGVFNLHHDSDKHGRVVTVLYYLNGVAGTWFPLASGTNSMPTTSSSAMSLSSIRDSPKTEDTTKDIIDRYAMTPGMDGLLVAGGQEYSNDKSELADNDHVVRIKSGDALVFYNYDSSSTKGKNEEEEESPSIDWRGIHAALPATEQKYIATHWFHGGEALTEISNI